jgi:hypothetical protein
MEDSWYVVKPDDRVFDEYIQVVLEGNFQPFEGDVKIRQVGLFSDVYFKKLNRRRSTVV